MLQNHPLNLALVRGTAGLEEMTHPMSLLICLTITMGLDKILWHNILMFSRFSAILKKEEMLTRLEYTFFPFNVEAQIDQSVNHKLASLIQSSDVLVKTRMSTM